MDFNNFWYMADRVSESQSIAEQLEDEEFKQQAGYDTDEDKLIDAERFLFHDAEEGHYDEEFDDER